MVFMFIAATAAFLCHTDESRLFAQSVVRGLAAKSMKHEEAAALMGLTAQMFSRQLAGREPLNAFRLTSLPADVQIAILGDYLRTLNAEVITPEQVQLLKGAAALGARKMAQMLTFSSNSQQRKEA